jgi:uncharacterized protein YbaR (Trm112 family)
MDRRLLDLLVCPICKGPLKLSRGTLFELVCIADRLAYPIREDIPIMLPDEARILAASDPLLER